MSNDPLPSQRVLVIGGSLGGLLAAHLLRSSGWDVTVFERNAEDLTGRGAGISVLPQLIDILRRLGIDFDESMGVKVDSAVFLDRDGNIITERPTNRTMSSWGRLYRALKDALPAARYHLGMQLQAVEQNTDGVTAVFADGTRVDGDLLVAADGIHSTVRAQFLPQLQPRYAGYVAWRAMLEESEFPPEIHAAIFERYIFCLPEGELFLAYPVPGRNNDTQKGKRAYNIVWYRPADAEKLIDLCTDASGRYHEGAIAPPLIRSDVLDEIRATARALMAPQIAEIFCRSRPFFQPIFDLESPQLVFGRVALLGDAAYVARPHVGAGVTKAALDASCLADCVALDGIDAGLVQYQNAQQLFGHALVALGREEGAYLGAQGKPRAERVGGELERDIESVLRAHNSRGEKVSSIIKQDAAE